MRTIRLWTLGALAMLAALTACEGGSDGEDPPPTLAELLEESLELRGEFDGLEPTASSDLPTEGQASYEGVMVLDTQDDNALAGEMSMEVAFGEADPISGEVTNVVGEGRFRYDGSLAISDGGVFVAHGLAGFNAELEGTLTNPDDEELDLEADLFGTFAGDEDDALSHAAGVVEGTACGPEGCQGLGGGFVVER